MSKRQPKFFALQNKLFRLTYWQKKTDALAASAPLNMISLFKLHKMTCLPRHLLPKKNFFLVLGAEERPSTAMKLTLLEISNKLALNGSVGNV